MYIESIEIDNYRSIYNSGRITFAPGFNLVIGANNVGKSSLLTCCAGKFIGDPHKSLLTLPTRDETLIPITKVSMGFVATGGEVRRRFVREGVRRMAESPKLNDRSNTFSVFE